MSKKKWNEDDMIKAIALHENGLSITEAARKCNIPRTSLNNRLIHGDPIMNSKKRKLSSGSKNKWHEDDMIEAIALHENGLSKAEAARKCNIPPTSLATRLKNGEPKKRGRKSTLSKNDETDLKNYVTFMADSGTPVTPSFVRETAGRIANERYVFVK